MKIFSLFVASFLLANSSFAAGIKSITCTIKKINGQPAVSSYLLVESNRTNRDTEIDGYRQHEKQIFHMTGSSCQDADNNEWVVAFKGFGPAFEYSAEEVLKFTYLG